MYKVFDAATNVFDETSMSIWLDQLISSSTGRRKPTNTGMKHKKHTKTLLKPVNWTGLYELFVIAELAYLIWLLLFFSIAKNMKITSRSNVDNCNAVFMS